MLWMSGLAATRNGERVHEPISLQSTGAGLVEITGENGAGKTTLLRTLAGLHTQFEGEFQVTPVVYQGHRIGLDESLTPLQNLAWSAALADRADDEENVMEALRRVDMLRYGMTPVGQLSQGQQRRIAMARWCLDKADVWLLDEPLTALDQNGQDLVSNIFEAAAADGKLVVYSTHSRLALSDKRELFVETAGSISQ